MSRAAACDDVRRAALNTSSGNLQLQAVSGHLRRTQLPEKPQCVWRGPGSSCLSNMCGRKFIYRRILILNMHGSYCRSALFDVQPGAAGTTGSAGLFPSCLFAGVELCSTRFEEVQESKLRDAQRRCRPEIRPVLKARCSLSTVISVL